MRHGRGGALRVTVQYLESLDGEDQTVMQSPGAFSGNQQELSFRSSMAATSVSMAKAVKPQLLSASYLSAYMNSNSLGYIWIYQMQIINLIKI